MTEGYIGITSQSLNKRFRDHRYNSKNKHLSNRCKQNDTIIVCLHENLSKLEAEILEEKYRPFENIGWNINKGGNLPPSRKGKISSSTLLTGQNRTEKQKQASQKHSIFMKGNNSSGKRKNKIIHKNICLNCNEEFINKEPNKRKYCSRKCSAIMREFLKNGG